MWFGLGGINPNFKGGINNEEGHNGVISEVFP
jgi:hypothetical protein